MQKILLLKIAKFFLTLIWIFLNKLSVNSTRYNRLRIITTK